MAPTELLAARGIRHEEPCHACQGSGSKLYGSGATYHGGVGTASCERDLCDHCWGSGCEHVTWTNVKALEYKWRTDLRDEAMRYFAERLGCWMPVMLAPVAELVVELRRLSRSRKNRPHFFTDACQQLAKMLEDGTKGK